MTASELIILARYQLGDDQRPYKWSNAELIAYLNSAFWMACRKAALIRDVSTTDYCRIPLVTGTYDYALDQKVISIDQAKIAGQSQPLAKRDSRTFNKYYPSWRSDGNDLPIEFVTDYKMNYITLRPAPSVTYNGTYLWLEIYRLPTADVTEATLTTLTPEIKTEYLPYMIDYIMSRAFLKPGQMTFSQFKAQYHAGLWKRNIDEMLEAEHRLRWEGETIAKLNEGNT